MVDCDRSITDDLKVNLPLLESIVLNLVDKSQFLTDITVHWNNLNLELGGKTFHSPPILNIVFSL